MTKKQTSMRLSPATRAKLDALAARYGTRTTAIEVAIDRLHREEGMITQYAHDVRECELPLLPFSTRPDEAYREICTQCRYGIETPYGTYCELDIQEEQPEDQA